jgi:hypothetical protein
LNRIFVSGLYGSGVELSPGINALFAELTGCTVVAEPWGSGQHVIVVGD